MLRCVLQSKRLICNARSSAMHAHPMSTEIGDVIARKHYGFLGSGNMSQALVKGLLSSNIILPSQITMTDRFGTSFPDAKLFEAINKLLETYGVEYIQSNKTMAEKSDVIFACVKPNVLLDVLSSISSCLSEKILVSIAAGITLGEIEKVVPDSTRIIRIMPNTPCLVRLGTGVYASTKSVTKEDKELICKLCAPIFPVFEQLPESMFGAATGVAGSAPAYIYMIAEALTDGGVMLGLPRELAEKLVVNTILGSAAMIRETGKNPTQLKNDVCSPGGTTIQGVFTLEQRGLRATLMDTVAKVAQRSNELSKPTSSD